MTEKKVTIEDLINQFGVTGKGETKDQESYALPTPQEEKFAMDLGNVIFTAYKEIGPKKATLILGDTLGACVACLVIKMWEAPFEDKEPAGKNILAAIFSLAGRAFVASIQELKSKNNK